jgi:hypothetical protein
MDIFDYFDRILVYTYIYWTLFAWPNDFYTYMNIYKYVQYMSQNEEGKDTS